MSSLFANIDPIETRPPAACYARVAVERGIEVGGVGQSTLTYSAAEMLTPGERVEVPLGHGNKSVGGIVTEVGGPELADGYKLEKIKPILRRTGAGLSASLMELAKWISGYYVCPLGMVLATMMPAAVKHGVGQRTRVELDRAPTFPVEVKLKPAAQKAWESIAALAAGDLPLPPAELKAKLSLATLGPINQLVRAGLLVEVRRSVIIAASPSWERESVESGTPVIPPSLTQEQKAAVDGIANSAGKFGVHLLFGVTGSGKTEVYLKLIEAVLATGKSALVLVPEISLTPQTAGRFEARFRRDGVAVLHSGMAAARRHKHWALVASGAARVVVGARSAVFAPLSDLGIIVVDEEHDSGYKQDQLPRYNARDVAIKRAHLAGVPVVLGSATPSLESWMNAMTRKYALHRLMERVADAKMPKVTVVDTAAEARVRAKMAGPDAAKLRFEQIGPTLERAIEETLRDKGQVILLLNRRGYANFISCPNPKCGWVMQCSDCDAAMVHHKSSRLNARGGFVRCHHCLAEQMLPRECPLCASRVNLLGTGTQRVEEELARKFAKQLGGSPGDPAEKLPGLCRFDSDAMQTARDYHSVLSRFASGELRMLIGTQMVAKGLDFPNVRLVGIVNADTALTLPDFRAAERTFQLVSQVAGRAGRGAHPGRVIVQTASPGTAAIRYAAAHDFVSFANDEMQHRKHAGLPPFTRMARIVVRDEKLEKAEQHAAELAEALKGVAPPQALRIDGPVPCAIARIGGFHRIELVLTSPKRSSIQDALGALRGRGLLTSDAHTAIDVDPVAMM